MLRHLTRPMCILWVLSLLTVGHAHTFSLNTIGSMPEVLVIAPRYEYEDEAWSGLMEEILVTTSRPDDEDLAWSGLMDTIVVFAPRYGAEDVSSAGMLAGVQQNIMGDDNASFKTSMQNREGHQSFHRETNPIFFAHVQLPIYFIIFGMTSFVITLFLLFHFMRKYCKLASEMSACGKRIR